MDGEKAAGLVSPEFCEKYWQAAKGIIDVAGKYASAIKLKNNLDDENTRHKVQSCFDSYYKGDPKKLFNSIRKNESRFHARVKKFNAICSEHNYKGVSKPDKLLQILLDEAQRDSLKRKMKRRLQKNEICSLQALYTNKR